MRRTKSITKKAKISSTTHVQLLQWLHGKQQQQPVLLEFVYVGEVSVSQDNLQSFLKTAGLLRIKGLAEDEGKSLTFKLDFIIGFGVV